MSRKWASIWTCFGGLRYSCVPDLFLRRCHVFVCVTCHYASCVIEQHVEGGPLGDTQPPSVAASWDMGRESLAGHCSCPESWRWLASCCKPQSRTSTTKRPRCTPQGQAPKLLGRHQAAVTPFRQQHRYRSMDDGPQTSVGIHGESRCHTHSALKSSIVERRPYRQTRRLVHQGGALQRHCRRRHRRPRQGRDSLPHQLTSGQTNPRSSLEERGD